jgi:hypothetical protein
MRRRRIRRQTDDADSDDGAAADTDAEFHRFHSTHKGILSDFDRRSIRLDGTGHETRGQAARAPTAAQTLRMWTVRVKHVAKNLPSNAFYILLGAVVAMVDYALERLTELLLNVRQFNNSLSFWTDFGLSVIFSTALILLCTLLTLKLSPAAIGSGIPVSVLV